MSDSANKRLAKNYRKKGREKISILFVMSDSKSSAETCDSQKTTMMLLDKVTGGGGGY